MKRVFMMNSKKASLFKSDAEVWIKFMPIWFRFLELIIIMGVFQYLAELTNHWLIKIISVLNYLSFGLYIQSIFFCVEHVYIKNKKIRRIFALLFATLITFLLLIFVTIVITQIKKYL